MAQESPSDGRMSKRAPELQDNDPAAVSLPSAGLPAVVDGGCKRGRQLFRPNGEAGDAPRKVRRAGPTQRP